MTVATDADLLRLAKAAGLQPLWRDAAGVERRVSATTLRAVLEELGLASKSPAQCRASLEWLGGQSASQAGTGLFIVRQGQPAILPEQTSLHYQLTLEGGERLRGTVGNLGNGRVALPSIQRPGYHCLELGGLRCTLAVTPAQAPSVDTLLEERGWLACGEPPLQQGRLTSEGPLHGNRKHARAWVLGAQLYGLQRAKGRNDNAGGREGAWPGWETGGDFSLLGRLAESAGQHGAAALAISPVHAMFAADPGRDSPYAPSSRLFLNVMYADPASRFATDFLPPPGGSERGAPVDADGCMNWPVIHGLRMAQLRSLFERFDKLRPQESFSDFSAFLQAGGEALLDHACYEALHAHFLPALGAGHGWADWPASYRQPQGAAVKHFAATHQGELRFHAFLQWLAARSLAEAQTQAAASLPLGLIADLAVGTDPRGSHAWSRQAQIMTGVSVGAPPDLFQPAGQNWGLTAFSPWALRRQGYAGFIETLRAVLAHAGGLRVDHIMGLMRMWLVPAGAPASEGVYLGYPFNDLADLLMLEAWRHDAVVVGESLGTVPEGFTDALERRGVLSMSVLWFERDAQTPPGFLPPERWPVYTLAMASTHDLPTVRGWWAGSDIDWRERRGDYDAAQASAQRQRRETDKQSLWSALQAAGFSEPGQAMPPDAPVAAILAYVAATPAALHHVALEDLTGQLEQSNLPGSAPGGQADPHPNWRRTLGLPVEGLLTQGDAPEMLRVIRKARGVEALQKGAAGS